MLQFYTLVVAQHTTHWIWPSFPIFSLTRKGGKLTTLKNNNFIFLKNRITTNEFHGYRWECSYNNESRQCMDAASHPNFSKILCPLVYMLGLGSLIAPIKLFIVQILQSHSSMVPHGKLSWETLRPLYRTQLFISNYWQTISISQWHNKLSVHNISPTDWANNILITESEL